MFKQLLKNKIVFAIIAGSLLLAGSTMKIKLPSQIEGLFKNDLVKVALLFLILYIGKLAIHYALIGAILFIVLSDKLNDKEIENFVN
jgi:hypothetical protein